VLVGVPFAKTKRIAPVHVHPIDQGDVFTIDARSHIDISYPCSGLAGLPKGTANGQERSIGGPLPKIIADLGHKKSAAAITVDTITISVDSVGMVLARDHFTFTAVIGAIVQVHETGRAAHLASRHIPAPITDGRRVLERQHCAVEVAAPAMKRIEVVASIGAAKTVIDHAITIIVDAVTRFAGEHTLAEVIPITSPSTIAGERSVEGTDHTAGEGESLDIAPAQAVPHRRETLANFVVPFTDDLALEPIATVRAEYAVFGAISATDFDLGLGHFRIPDGQARRPR